MAEPKAPMNEHIAAQQTLLAATRRVSEALPQFSTWLLGGLAAAFALVIANVETVSKFIAITHIRFGLLVFLASLALAVIVTYLSTVVRAGLAAQEDGESLGKKIAASSAKLDLNLYMAEYERGLLPPVRWIARSAMKKTKAGDVVAGARMIAKLSQLQALLVVLQGALAVVAIGALAFGLKMQ